MAPSLGQQERERAFVEWLTRWSLENSVSDHIEDFATYEGRRVRASFDAGVEVGQELRGCCDHRKERDES